MGKRRGRKGKSHKNEKKGVRFVDTSNSAQAQAFARSKKNNNDSKNANLNANNIAVPRSFVVRRGKVGKSASDLVDDLRNVMSPNTASRLRENRHKNTVKDYLHVAGPLNVSHLMMISQSKRGPNLKIGRLPQGPTLSFQITRFTTCNQLRSTQKRPVNPTASFSFAPLVVLNNFENEQKRHLRIAALTFQAMFPPINVQNVKVKDCRRVLLLHYDPERDETDLRHFLIRTVPAGVNRNVKKLLKSKKNPEGLKKKTDFGDILEPGESLGGGYATSDSEAEDEDSRFILPDSSFTDSNNKQNNDQVSASVVLEKLKRKLGGRGKSSIEGNLPSGDVSVAAGSIQNAVKLSEIGPRISLKLIKIENGAFEGEVQYHAFQQRSIDEIETQRLLHEKKKKEKEARRLEQEENVQRKRKLEEEKAEKKKAKRIRANLKRQEREDNFFGNNVNDEVAEDDDNDIVSDNNNNEIESEKSDDESENA